MGIESRDWFRDDDPRGRRRRSSQRRFILGILIGLVLLLAASPTVSSRLGYTPPFGVAGLYPGDRSGQVRLELAPWLVGAGDRDSLYARNDPWKASLADEQTCPRGEDRRAAPAVQAQVLLCLVNYARERRGVRPLVLSRVLSRTAASKARDIVRCRDFSHQACGKRTFQAAANVGYRGSLGENLYVAEGARAAPRPALDAWLNSTRHRKNLLAPKWRSIGIALHGGADVERIRNGVVWVNHFG